MQHLIDDFNQAVSFYYQLAQEKYPDLSSFAIVTDESFDTFLIAVNHNEFFDDLKNENIADEDYWNTAEWTDECFDRNAFNINIEDINNFISENRDIDENEFLDMCLNALKSVHKDICVFVHITDFAFHQKLYDIVKELNGDEIAKSYQDYYLACG